MPRHTRCSPHCRIPHAPTVVPASRACPCSVQPLPPPSATQPPLVPACTLLTNTRAAHVTPGPCGVLSARPPPSPLLAHAAAFTARGTAQLTASPLHCATQHPDSWQQAPALIAARGTALPPTTSTCRAPRSTATKPRWTPAHAQQQASHPSSVCGALGGNSLRAVLYTSLCHSVVPHRCVHRAHSMRSLVRPDAQAPCSLQSKQTGARVEGGQQPAGVWYGSAGHGQRELCGCMGDGGIPPDVGLSTAGAWCTCQVHRGGRMCCACAGCGSVGRG